MWVQQFNCVLCGTEFTRWTWLPRWLQTHADVAMQTCDACTKKTDVHLLAALGIMAVGATALVALLYNEWNVVPNVYIFVVAPPAGVARLGSLQRRLPMRL